MGIFYVILSLMMWSWVGDLEIDLNFKFLKTPSPRVERIGIACRVCIIAGFG